MSANVLRAIAVAAELTGTELSATALKVMGLDLSAYPETAVLQALDRCRRELKGRLTLAAVLERIEETDGRPGADEAWAIALGAADEAETVVWTEEIAQAFAVAQPVLEARDKVGARVAFRDAYERIVRDARTAALACRWVVSNGYDPERRAVALRAAVALKRLDAAAVAGLLPSADAGPVVAALIENNPQALLQDKTLSDDERETNLRGVAAVRAHLAELDRLAMQRRQAAADAAIRQREAEERRRREMLDSAHALLAQRGEVDASDD